MKYNTVIYDLDGTLLYTLEDLMNSVNYALDHYGYPHRNIDEIRSFIGNGVAVLMKRSAPENCPEDELKVMCEQVIDANPQSVEDYKNGKDRAIGFIIGQVMKQSRGKANPQMVSKIVMEIIKGK